VYSKVRKGATNKPPMMVIAIGPQNAERDSGIIARIAASAVSTTGGAAARWPRRWLPFAGQAVGDVGFDLVHQDHRRCA